MLPSPPEHLQELTREYARFARTAGGLSAVIGGGFCLVSYLAGGLLPMSPALRIALTVLPLAWLASKQWLARHYYQRYGRVEEITTPGERRARVAMVAGIAVISVLVVVGYAGGGTPAGPASWDLGSVGYVALLLCMPAIAWYWLRTPMDLAVGVFLLCQAALAFTGRSYALWSSAAVFPVVALLLIAAGIREHRRFVAIQAEIRALIASRRATA